MWKADIWNLKDFNGLELHVRGQGENLVYKVVLKHHGGDGDSISYETFFKVCMGRKYTL